MRTVKCDACHIADAYVIANKGRKVLVFCLHDCIKHREALLRQGWLLLVKGAKQ